MLARFARRAAVLSAVVVLLPGGSPLAAQASDAPPLTVERAVTLARARHLAIVAAGARRQADVGLVRQQAALPNPVVEWRQENMGSPLAPDVFVTVSQPLGLTGRRPALRSEASAVDERAVADSVTVTRDVEANAARAFWRASLARGLLALAVDLRTDAERLACLEAERARSGAVAELSAMRVRVEAERARLAEATAGAEWARASAELAGALGLPPTELPTVPPLQLASSSPTPIPTTEVVVAGALARRSELVAMRAGVEAARHRVTAERRSVVPDVALQAGTKRTAGYTTRVVGVAVPLPLLDRNAGARESAAGALRLAQANLGARVQAVRAEVVAAVTSLRAHVDARVPGPDSLAAHAQEIAQVADAAYAAGGGSLLELLDARRARAEALTAALRWSAEVRLTRLELNRASGLPLLDSLETP